MNVYVETNFVLELVFQQEQFTSCEQILQLAEAGHTKLIMPAYSLAEPHEKLNRQAKSRRDLQQILDTELRQLARTASYITRIKVISEKENTWGVRVSTSLNSRSLSWLSEVETN